MLESGYAKNISDAGGSGVNDDGDDEDDETGKSIAQPRYDDDDDDDDGNKQIGCWYGKGENNFGRAKRVILYPFLKAKIQLRRKNKRASSSSSSSSSPSISNTTKTISSDKVGAGAIVDGSVNQGCSVCFTKIQISGSKNGSQTSDPNDRKFTHEMLKVLIEKNVFYSKECNPHLGTGEHFTPIVTRANCLEGTIQSRCVILCLGSKKMVAKGEWEEEQKQLLHCSIHPSSSSGRFSTPQISI